MYLLSSQKTCDIKSSNLVGSLGAFARDESTIERRGLHLQLAHLEGLVVWTAAIGCLGCLKGIEIAQIYWDLLLRDHDLGQI